MQYISTRDKNTTYLASQAIAQGLAPDGGLMTPAYLPKLPGKSLSDLKEMSYQQRAVYIMKLFLDEFSVKELTEFAAAAYGPEKFDTPAVAPVRALDDGTFCLELWHGPTCAFKDMALQMLPHLLTASLVKTEEEKTVCILVATSGDTGKGALEGFRDVDRTRILVFYPKDGVSAIQELQMVTQEGKNVGVCSVFGNFDDAQTGVKKLFNNKELARELSDKGFLLSSANSINIGRLVPQVVYYVYAYAKLLANGEIAKDEKVNVVVPTGNFGNILAAYFAKQMGVPFGKLICASNDNKVLYDFFQTGTYDKNREFILTTSPSMDILVSSNLERLLYLSCGRDAAKTKELMEQLSKNGKYEITPEMKEFMKDFSAGYADMEENAKEIKKVFDDTGYLIDTHTGVAAAVYEQYKAKTGDATKTVIASTASPYKFSRSVMEAVLGKKEDTDEFALIDEMERISGVKIPQAIEEIRDAKILHNRQCKPEEMEETVKQTFSK